MTNFLRVAAFAAISSPALFALTVTPTTLANGAVGISYSQTVTCNCEGNLTWSYSGTLPPGLSFSSSGATASITGTPTTGGTYSFTVQVTSFIAQVADVSAPAGSQSYTVSIAQISPATLSNANLNVSYLQTFTVSYGSGSYVWSAPVTPPGLTLSSSGTLSGTPTSVGNFSFTVSASPVPGAAPASNVTVSASYLLSVVNPLKFTSSVTLPNGVQGINYSSTLAAIGGNPPYTFALASSVIAPNTLPPGLILNSNGALQGVPTTPGAYGFNIDLTDSASNQVEAFFELTVAPPFSISTASPLPTGSLQVAYSQSITAIGGNPPYTFSTAGGQLPTGITLQSSGAFTGTATTTGTFSFTAQASDSFGYTTTKPFQLSIAPAGPLLQATPLQLTFSAGVGVNPAPQTIAIVAPSNDPVNFAAQILPVSGTMPGWITLSSTGGAAPAALAVNIATASLAAGNYQATVQITDPNSSAQAPINIAVSLTITSTTATFGSSPASLRFLTRSSTPSTQEQIVTALNVGASATPSVSVMGKSAWISTSAKGATVQVTVNSQGLGVGSYHDVVQLTSGSQSVQVPVSLFVQAAGPSLALGASGLRFESRQGAGSTMPQTVNVLNLGDSGTTVNWSVQLLSGSNWLTLNPGSGTATSSAPGRFTISPSAATTSLPAGPQYALLSVSDPNSLNSPQYLTAVLDNEPASSPALPDPSLAGLYFTSAIGAQTILLYTSSTSPVGFGVSTSTASGGSWLTATPSSGTASTSSPAQISVSASATGLSPGIYFGSVNIEMNSVLRTVAVTFIVLPPSTTGSIVHPDATCSASQLAITQTGLAGSFSVPAGWPATLIVQLNDNCGNAVSNGSVIASFSSGDPPLSLRGDGVSDIYSATWQPIATSPETTVTLQATAGTLQATEQVTGAVNQNSNAPPTFVSNGTLDIFFNVATANSAGYALAPGSVIQVYGSGFAPSLVAPPNVPLLNQISGTFLLIGSTQVPLFFVDGTVLAAQVPFELAANQQYQAILSANGALTLPETLDVVPMQPGVLFSVSDGTVVAQRADGSLVTASSPAHPGDALTLYLTGMGATIPAVASGTATPLQLVPAATPPVVTLGGETVNIAYAGLTPTGIGLYQINFTVPSDAQAGNLPLVITQNGVAANATTLPVSN